MSTERELEQLSALVDGALDEGPGRSVLARLGDQPALRARWGRYHLIGDVLRGEPVAGAALDVASLRAQLRTSLADYKVPRHIEIRDALPREDSGKIFKRRLRDPYWERAGRKI